jgi:hypothetical protein
VDNSAAIIIGTEKAETSFMNLPRVSYSSSCVRAACEFFEGNDPVDYNYHPDFIGVQSSNIYEPLRYYHSMNAIATQIELGHREITTGGI